MLRRLIPDKLTLWIFIYLLGLIFFAFFRILFLATHRDLWGISDSGNILYSFLIGIRFDTVILSIIILPLFLITIIPFVKISSKIYRTIIITFLTILYAIINFGGLADTRFFDQFGSHLNYWAVEYMEYPGMFLYTISTAGTFWITIISWIILTWLYYYLLRKIFNKTAKIGNKGTIISNAIVYLVAVALMLLGIRGSLGMKALDWGTAFHCDNQFVNQVSLNPIFTLSHSIYEELNAGKTFMVDTDSGDPQYYTKASATVYSMLNLEKTDDTLVPIIPAVEYPDTVFRQNVIVIIMESWSADFIGALGSDLGISPNFDSLSQNGLLYTDFYANGIRTNRGIPAVLCSFPSLPGRSIMKRYAADRPFTSIARLLEPYGYYSAFAYGGDLEFDNIRGFLKSLGYEHFYGEDDFDKPEYAGKWGVPDHVVFNTMLERIKQMPRPFNLAILTLSNHDPYIVPDDRFKLYDDSIPNHKYYNTFYYTDHALGDFFRDLDSTGVLDSTIVIVTADHCPHQSARHLIDPNSFRIPLLIYPLNNCVDFEVYPRTNITGSQVDILPTLADLLNIPAAYPLWGQDLLAIPDSTNGFAVVTLDDRIGLIEDSMMFIRPIADIYHLYDLNRTPYLADDLLDSLPEISARMKNNLEAYTSLAEYLSRGGPKKTIAIEN